MISFALVKARAVTTLNVWLHGLAVVSAVAGGAMASSGLVPARMVGLGVLGCVAGAQMWSGAAVSRTKPRAAAIR